jgi:ATP-dependent protease HslVU (ClpYQ) ATPase subunit
LDALVGNKASLATRESFRKRLRDGDLDDNEIEIAVNDQWISILHLKFLECLEQILV